MEKRIDYDAKKDQIELLLNCIAFGKKRKNVYEIFCTGDSISAVNMILRQGRIKSYRGASPDVQEVQRVRGGGLDASLILRNEDVIRELDALKEKGNGVVMMVGFPETLRQKAEEYKRLADERNLKVMAYPPLK